MIHTGEKRFKSIFYDLQKKPCSFCQLKSDLLQTKLSNNDFNVNFSPGNLRCQGEKPYACNLCGP